MFRSSMIIGVQGIRARKLRTLLSMLSLFLGVLAVVVVQAAAETARGAVLANWELTNGKDGTRQIYVPPGPGGAIALDVLRGASGAVGLIGTSAIVGEPGLRPVNPGGGRVEGSERVPPQGAVVICRPGGICDIAEDRPAELPPGKAIELSLIGLTGDIRQFRPFRIESGQWLDFAGAPSLAPRIVLNRAAAQAFRGLLVPAEMRFEGGTANPTPRIIGVVDDGSLDPAAYVRADELLTWLPATALSDFRTSRGMQLMLSPAAADVEQILRARLVAGGVPADQLQVQPGDSKERVASELALMRAIFLGLAGLVLLIGIAGILNVGLATVGERVEEFALRRAVGTPRSLLAAIVLAETLLTGLFTAGAAIGVAALAIRLAPSRLGGPAPYIDQLEFPWQAAAAGILAGLVAGLLGGLVPALRAARIPIASVMRA